MHTWLPVPAWGAGSYCGHSRVYLPDLSGGLFEAGDEVPGSGGVLGGAGAGALEVMEGGAGVMQGVSGTAVVSGHAVFVTLTVIAAILVCGAFTAIPLVRTVRASTGR